MRFKKIISSILAFATVISIIPAATYAAEAVHTTLYKDDFESYDVSEYPKPKPTGLTVTGDNDSVYVDTVGTTQRLWLRNDGFINTLQVEKSFTQVTGKTVFVEFDFLQLHNKSKGDTVFGLYSGDSSVFLLNTKDGDIVATAYSVESDSVVDVIVVDDYAANKEYSFKLEVDLFAHEVKIYVEDDFAASAVLKDSSDTIDNFRIFSKQFPGFTVDDIDIYMEENVNTVTVTGDKKPVIPTYDSVEYEYTATITDSNGSAVNTTTVDWSLVGAPSGVSLAGANGNTVKLTVSKDAPAATFSIKAQVRDSEISGTLSVATEPLGPSALEVVGWQDKVEIIDRNGNRSDITYPSYRITAEDREPKTYKFKARVLDQFGNEVENFGTFRWELFGIDSEPEVPDYVSVNPASGVVTVKKNPTTEQLIGIRAVANDDTTLKGETKLSLLDLDTYAMDKVRLDAVIEHIETSLESGSIEGSPLISNVFVRGDRTPVRTVEGTKDVISSNVMAESNLLRAMYNLSEITENSKYKDRVDEIYRYMMTTGLLSDGVRMAWGGHMTMDMENEEMFASYLPGTHEIKGVQPFVAPMVSENVNFSYEEDENGYNNGFGFGGFLFRAIIAGHAMGNYTTLEFERHWTTTTVGDAYAFEPVWKTPEVFDDDRRGPEQRSGGAPFNGVAGQFIGLLTEYYRATGDEYSLSWAKNFMNTVLNSAFTYYVYKNEYGEYIWPSDTTNMKYTTDDEHIAVFGETAEPKRKYLDKNNELRYTSIKSDIKNQDGEVYTTNFIYEHRDLAELDAEGNVTNTVRVYDVKEGRETELTLCEEKTWSDGTWNEMATMIGDQYKLDLISHNLGQIWYKSSGYKSPYGGTTYGDRLYNNIVHGTDENDGDTWVEQGIITEEEGSLMMDPYTRMREIGTVGDIVYAMCDVIDALSDADRMDEAMASLDNLSRGVYTDLRRGYSFTNDCYNSYMTWIRPEYMRSNEITCYKDMFKETMSSYSPDSEEYKFWDKYGDLPWNIDIPESVKRKMFLKADRSLVSRTHRGYYGDPALVTLGSKQIEPAYMGSYIILCVRLRDAIERLEATAPSDPDYEANMNQAQVFRNRVRYIWRVLRDLFNEMAPMGDIGEDFFDLDSTVDLDMGTSSSSYLMVEMMIRSYQATNNKEFLKCARAVANNWIRSNYSASEQMFTTTSAYFGAVSNDMLQLLIELDALILDRFDENIPYTTLKRGAEFYDTYYIGKDGSTRQYTTFVNDPATVYENDTVKAKEIDILHDVIELNVGDSIKIDYEIIPYDTASQDVIWDVYDQRVAMMDPNTTTLYALKKGKTKIRCVSTSQLGLASEEVEVIVK